MFECNKCPEISDILNFRWEHTALSFVENRQLQITEKGKIAWNLAISDNID